MYIDELVKKMNNKTLVTCVEEILDWHKCGVLASGKVRELADDIVKITKSPESKLQLAENNVLKEAARRFVVLSNAAKLP
jgi:hypothetical protein